MFVSCIGDGSLTSLWLDYWLLDGQCFCDLFPFKTLSSTGLFWDAKVIDIVEDGGWDFPSGSKDLQQIWDCIKSHPELVFGSLCLDRSFYGEVNY